MGLRFVYPEFLFSLLLLAIPVIIHLFNFRRYKKIFFTNVQFLKEVKEETTSRSKLKHLLVLFARLLAVSFLIFAFAQPYIPSASQEKITNSRAVSIYVDNSFSMEASGREGTLLDEAKDKAAEVAKAYQPSDRFQLLTSDFDPAHQRLVNREEFLDQVQQVRISPDVKSLSEVVSRQADALNNSGSKEKSAFIISDFQKTTTDLANCKSDSAIRVGLFAVKSELRNNIFIDSCWFTSPIVQLNTPCEVNIRVKNSSQAVVENIPVKLVINGLQKSLASVTVPSEGSAVITMSFSITAAGWQKATVSLTDNPVTFDDQYFFSFNVSGHIQIISINGSGESVYLKALFGSGDNFGFSNTGVSQIDFGMFPKSQLIILNELPEVSSGLAGELKKFVTNGGSLVIFPDSNPDLQSYNSLMASLNADGFTGLNTIQDKVARIDAKSDLFADVFEKVPENMDLPVAEKHFEMTSSTRTSKEVLMRLEGGSPLLSRYALAKGKIYVFTVPLNPVFSGLARHAVFVPAMYKIALLSKASSALSYVIGKNASVNIGNAAIGGEDVFHLVNEVGKIDVIPGHRNDQSGTIIDIPADIRDAGNYELTWKGNVTAVISLNYDRKESEMSAYLSDELSKQAESGRLFNFRSIAPETKDITRALREMNEGTRLWKWCIIFALLFLIAEILLLKLLK